MCGQSIDWGRGSEVRRFLSMFWLMVWNNWHRLSICWCIGWCCTGSYCYCWTTFVSTELRTSILEPDLFKWKISHNKYDWLRQLMDRYLNTGFTQTHFCGQFFAHERIGIVRAFENLLQCCQLATGKCCTISTWFLRWVNQTTAGRFNHMLSSGITVFYEFDLKETRRER